MDADLIEALWAFGDGYTLDAHDAEVIRRARLALSSTPQAAQVPDDTARLDFIERTFTGMSNSERYLPRMMGWGKGYNGRTLRQACDKYMAREKELDARRKARE